MNTSQKKDKDCDCLLSLHLSTTLSLCLCPMFAQVRTFSVLSSVVRSSATRSTFNVSPVLPKEPLSEGDDRKRRIENRTLELLQDSVNKDRSKPMVETVQRYQKIHRVGDIYHPDSLNDTHYQEKLRQRRGKQNVPTADPFDTLGLNPLDEYKNYRLLSHFVSDIGKILPRTQTGVTAKNQRKLAQAIKRARAMGLMSCTSKYVPATSYIRN
ncbi:ribosomal protein S18 [Spinellus fusiger]|nr:ribosomal protein S18 [Spinellus fusiger]